jgi:hypothetical protein
LLDRDFLNAVFRIVNDFQESFGVFHGFCLCDEVSTGSGSDRVPGIRPASALVNNDPVATAPGTDPSPTRQIGSINGQRL